jgi:hypothetical protein
MDMVRFAYRDSRRSEEEIAFAEDLCDEDLGTRFYCPNSDCDAYMYLRQKRGLDGRSATFCARPSQPHIKEPKCLYGSRESGGKPEEPDEATFDFDKRMAALMKPSSGTGSSQQPKKVPKNPGKSRISNLLQVYYLCKNRRCADKYNGTVVGFMLLDDRSRYMYPKGVYGNKIVEGSFVSELVDPVSLEIGIEAPPANPDYVFILKFDKQKPFEDICNALQKNQARLVIVGGKWEIYGYHGDRKRYKTTILEKKQIHLLGK